MASGAPGHDIGKEFELTDPTDTETACLYGGTIRDWLPLENALMRRKITYVLLAALAIALAASVYLASRGTQPATLLAIAILVAAPLSVVVRYYFHETAQ